MKTYITLIIALMASAYAADATPASTSDVEISGIGILLNPSLVESITQPKSIFISEVFSGGPAELCGLKRDDLILEIDGITPTNENLKDFILMTRGAPGTEVVIKVLDSQDKLTRKFLMKRIRFKKEIEYVERIVLKPLDKAESPRILESK
jgi:C-terminal processing protease CtpA/Prc